MTEPAGPGEPGAFPRARVTRRDVRRARRRRRTAPRSVPPWALVATAIALVWMERCARAL